MTEPSYLELRGALNLVLDAKKKLPVAGWAGASTYYTPSRAENEAKEILYKAESSLRADIKAMLGQNKEARQAEALRTIR